MLERWAEAVEDYEVLRRELPDDNEVVEPLFHAQVALKKSHSEKVYNMKFDSEVEEVCSLECCKESLKCQRMPLKARRRGTMYLYLRLILNHNTTLLVMFLRVMGSLQFKIFWLQFKENRDIVNFATYGHEVYICSSSTSNVR